MHERQPPLGLLGRLRDQKATRSGVDVDAELKAIRTSRRSGGRRHPAR
jgi:hypothetical protein